MAFHRWCLNNFEPYIRRDGFDVKREWRARYQHIHSVQIPENQAISARCSCNSKGQKRGAIAILYIPTAKPRPGNKGSCQVSSLLIPPSRAHTFPVVRRLAVVDTSLR